MHLPESSRPGFVDYTLLITLAAIWGASFYFIKLAVDTIPAVTLTLGRLAIGALFLYAIARIYKEPFPKDLMIWVYITLSAFIGSALPFTLISWGEETVDSGIAAILMGVAPLTTIFIAHFLTKDEKLNIAKIIAVVLGIFGLIVLMGSETFSTLGDDTVRQIAIAGAAFCYGLNTIITKSLIHLPKHSMVAAILIVSTIMMLPASIAWDKPWTLTPSSSSLISMAILGLLQTALAGLMMFIIIERQSASFFSQINFFVPIFGVVWGIAFLSEQIPPNGFIALGIILLGMLIARHDRYDNVFFVRSILAQMKMFKRK
ncbi:MAG: DMT family transporter [Pseudomonadota bacterium]